MKNKARYKFNKIAIPFLSLSAMGLKIYVRYIYRPGKRDKSCRIHVLKT